MPQPTKTPKTTTKLKLTTPKTPATGEPGKKTTGSAKAPKGKNANTKKSAAKASISDEDTAAENLKEPEKPLDPQEAKTKKEREGEVNLPTFNDLSLSSLPPLHRAGIHDLEQIS